MYDSSRTYPIEAVTVMSTGGRGTLTDTLGRYTIEAGEKDSIWFSFQGKATPKYAILKMPDITRFNIALRLKLDIMQEVKIKSRSYTVDSLQNRKDYAKIFDYHKPRFSDMTSIGATGAAFDLDAIIELFQFKKRRATLKFQERLLEQEQTRFVDHRFNKALVRRLTGLDSTALTQFMITYRPSYEFTLLSSEYDFQLYIKQSFERSAGRKPF